MKAKTKLMLTIMSMCLILSFAVLGIFAVTTLNMSVGGNISFSADGISVVVSDGVFKTQSGATYENIMTDKNKLQGFEMNTDTKLSDIQTQLASWGDLDLMLSNLGDAYLHFSITNKMETTLYVYVSVNIGTNFKNMEIKANPIAYEFAGNEQKNYVITFDILDMSINAEISDFSIEVMLQKESIMKTQNKIDSTTGLELEEWDYSYLELGTYNGQPVRWRYVASADGTPYTGTTAPTTISGYYIQETFIDKRQAFLGSSKYSSSKHIADGYTSIYANDYALSDLRAYLTGAGTGSFMSDLSISKGNIIYSLIEGRTVADLYSNINHDGSAITASNSNFALSLKGDKDVSGQVDKFWSMSYKELSTYIPTQSDRIWDNNYWTRSFVQGLWSNAFAGDAKTGMIDYLVVGTTICVRAAFKIA